MHGSTRTRAANEERKNKVANNKKKLGILNRTYEYAIFYK
jgi:hypothetical protein